MQHTAQHTVQHAVHGAAHSAMQPAQAVKMLLMKFQAGQTGEEWDSLVGVGQPGSIWEQLQLAREKPRKKCMILLAVHSEAPQHWSLLSLARKAAADSQEPNKFRVMYWDSMVVPGQSALETAAASLQLLARLVQPAEVQMPVLPLVVATRCYKQADQYSCGYWVLKHAELMYRLYRGEGWRAPSPDIREAREQLNNWLTSLSKFILKRQHKEEPAELKAQKKQKLAEALAAAAGASSSTSEPKAPLPANSVQQDDLNHGCSKCRWSLGGCLTCCPAKAAKYAGRKLAESQLAESQLAESQG